MNNITTIYVIRHGESEGNVGIFHGEKHELGSKLTENGQNQARKLKDKLKETNFDAVFSSDMNRAQQTAEIIALERKLAVNTTNLIRERSFYHYLEKLQKTEEELIQEMILDLKKLDEKEKMQYKHSQEMESAEEAAIRLLTFIRESAIAYNGKTIMVVCHGNIMRSLLTHLGFATFDQLPSGSINNTGYFVLESDGVDFFVKDTYGVHKQMDGLRDF